jgi:hypothetical protein
MERVVDVVGAIRALGHFDVVVMSSQESFASKQKVCSLLCVAIDFGKWTSFLSSPERSVTDPEEADDLLHSSPSRSGRGGRSFGIHDIHRHRRGCWAKVAESHAAISQATTVALRCPNVH